MRKCREEKERLERYKPTDDTDEKMYTDFCKGCGRLTAEAEERNALLLRKQEELLDNINKTKAEALQTINQTKEKLASKEDNNADPEAVFNMKKLASFQELLDHAEATGEMLLFTDKKQNVWQIVKRSEIDIVDNGPEDLDEQEDPNEEEPNSNE